MTKQRRKRKVPTQASAGGLLGASPSRRTAPEHQPHPKGECAVELFTLCLAIAYMVTGKFNKDTAIAAYQHGQEPPGLAKARMRHERRGGHYNESGRPVGPGSTRLLLSTWRSEERRVGKECRGRGRRKEEERAE